jgi:hypothetical protein
VSAGVRAAPMRVVCSSYACCCKATCRLQMLCQRRLPLERPHMQATLLAWKLWKLGTMAANPGYSLQSAPRCSAYSHSASSDGESPVDPSSCTDFGSTAAPPCAACSWLLPQRCHLVHAARHLDGRTAGGDSHSSDPDG